MAPLSRLKDSVDALHEQLSGADHLGQSERESLESLLSEFERGAELLELDELLGGCLVQKDGAKLFSRG